MKKVFLFFLFWILSNSISLAQNWFPLEIGNRWDFYYWTQCPGGYGMNDTLIIEVIGDTSFQTSKNYFILSTEIYGSKFILNDNDSLFIFNTDGSFDCLVFAFNQSINSFYSSCKYDSVFFLDTTINMVFGVNDIQQNQGTFFTANTFSKKFGLIDHFYLDGLCENYLHLNGCVIGGITYGELLSNTENFVNSISGFSLSQNYPNPFNPSTSIQYAISNRQFVTLKVYDVLGKEVATLVNEEKPAGNYNIEFYGSNLASGIYYYQLRAGEFVEVKKMILLK
jgi:hypothetical protein